MRERFDQARHMHERPLCPSVPSVPSCLGARLSIAKGANAFRFTFRFTFRSTFRFHASANASDTDPDAHAGHSTRPKVLYHSLTLTHQRALPSHLNTTTDHIVPLHCILKRWFFDVAHRPLHKPGQHGKTRAP